MSEQTQAVAAPSAVPAIEVDRGALVNMTGDQRAEFRRTGELPEPPKIEDPTPSTTETTPIAEADEAKPAGDTATPQKPQEQRRKPGAEKRIGELTSDNKRLKAELEALKSPKPAAEAVKPQTEQAKPTPQARQKPTPNDTKPDGTPRYQTYEDFSEDLADWKYEQRHAADQRDQQQQTQRKELETKITNAKQRYGDKFDQVLLPTVNSILADQAVSPSVKAMLNDSDMLPDLIFTIGSDPKELASFVEMAKKNPGKALRYIALTESLIRDELSTKQASSDTKPAPPKTNAPKPPAEVGGRAATPGDPVESAAKNGDYRAYSRARTQRDLARLRG